MLWQRTDTDKQLNTYLTRLEVEGASQHTLAAYGRGVRHFLDWLSEQNVKAWRGVTKAVIRAYIQELHGKEYANASIARRLSVLRSFCTFLVREGELEVNPFIGISSPKLPQRLPRYLKHAEVDALLEAATSPRDKAIIELLYASGIRLSELVGLNVGDLSLCTKSLRVRGKGDKERVVLVGVPATKALSEYLNVTEGTLDATRALFLSRNGHRLSRRSVAAILEKHGKAIGLKVTPHLLRHTFATHMIEGGAGLRVVQELLGHARPTTTEQYAHVTINGLKKAYQQAHPLAGGR